MAVDIQATGFVGIAFEATAGTYVAPTKFFPVRSESLKYVQETHWRRVIRGINDPTGAVAGHSFVEGDIEMELLEDVLPYFLYASRNTVVKTGTYVYTTTPFHGALPTSGRTLSITVVRAGIVFGYTGCLVSSFKISNDEQIGVMTFSILGRDEQVQSLPTATFGTTAPFAAGQWNLQIPTATQVFDIDTFEFSVEDNAEIQNRLWTTRAARYVKFGERDVQLTAERDFDGRVEYDAFKALTAQSITVRATKSASAQVTITLPAAIKDTYEITGLADQGELVRASIDWKMTYDATTSKSYQIVVDTAENIT